MKIPKKFEVFGETFTVSFDEELTSRNDMVGQSYLRENRIVLQKPGKVYPKSRIEQTFYHELVHVILDRISEHKLSGNEAFVDRFAGLLHQATKTMEF